MQVVMEARELVVEDATTVVDMMNAGCVVVTRVVVGEEELMDPDVVESVSKSYLILFHTNILTKVKSFASRYVQ